jgi:hypothetical protein
MIVEHITIPGETASLAKNPPAVPANAELLEHRIRRLEEAVAGLQDTRPLEERVIERVNEKLSHISSQSIQEPRSFWSDAARMAFDSGTNSLQAQPRRAWWLEAYDDLRAMVRMYFDPRYRRHMTWTAFLTPFVLLACVLIVWFWMPTSIPFLGPILAFLDKIVDVLLAFFAYKVLSRELHRYRAMTAGFPSSQP